MKSSQRIWSAALLGATLVAAAPPSPRAIVTEPRIHHRADPERSGSYHFPPIRRLPRVKWTKDQGLLFMGTPLATHGKLYSGGSDGTLYVFDARDGT
ncbi:MAG TPA: PQQ-binding-like beta-propeller repeat protein, partial [Candidatus Angelobacter sp.]|nr:PQQ-binding-like beta-propeller repeat protein [Candidatus Angelobacter sp.]